VLAGLETATKSGCDRQFGHPEPASSVGNLYLLVGYDHFDQTPTIQVAGTTITARKANVRTGASQWIITHAELTRIRNEGLLPDLRTHRHVG